MRSLAFALLVPLASLAACSGVFTDPQGHTGDVDAASPTLPNGTLVFTTSKLFRGGLLDGVAGADATCASQAAAAGLPGEFKAWLSDIEHDAADRLTHSTKPYVLVNGTIIANSWVELLQFDLQHAIDRDEHGTELAMDIPYVWTGTRIDGRAYPWTPGGTTTSNPRLDCTLWSSIDGGVGIVGLWSATNMTWTDTSSGHVCTESAHLYCFQQ